MVNCIMNEHAVETIKRFLEPLPDNVWITVVGEVPLRHGYIKFYYLRSDRPRRRNMTFKHDELVSK